MSINNLLAILASSATTATNNTTIAEDHAMNANTNNVDNNETNNGRRGLMLLTIPPIESWACLLLAAERIQAPQIEVIGQGIIALSQEVFFTDTTPAHAEFKELIEKVMARAEEIIKAPVTSMQGVDPRVVEERKFHVNDYLNVTARPKKAMEWCSEIEDLTKKMLHALNWTYVQAWQYLDKTERAQLVWRQLDIHMIAISVYFQDYAAYSMNELTTGKIAQIGLIPTSWDLREDKFEFGFETSGVQGPGYWQAYDKAECIQMWLAGTLDPEVMVRCSNAYGFAQLSPHRPIPWVYGQYFRK